MEFGKNRYTSNLESGSIMKTLMRILTFASLALLLILGGTTAAFAKGNQPQSQTLSLTVPYGGVTNLGGQFYAVSGGQVAFAEIAGQTINPGANVQYNFNATQNGMTTTGSGTISLTGTTTTGGAVVPISVSAAFTINGAEAGAVIGQTALPFVFLTSASSV